jgi:glycosyltransferase involved in cell wall biosynthesis
VSAHLPDSPLLVTVIVPLFNEEEAVLPLAGALDEMGEAIRGLGHRVDFVLVDDGSTDGTAWELALAFRGRADVHVVAHERNRGFGAAFRTGIAAARGGVVVCYDADRPYAPADAALLVEAVQGEDGADAATVSPWASGGGASGVPRVRVLLSRGVSLAYRVALRGKGAGLSCFTASFRAYKAGPLRDCPFRSDGFLATAEVLVALLWRGHRVLELPARLHRREQGASKMRVARTVFAHLGLLARTALTV